MEFPNQSARQIANLQKISGKWSNNGRLRIRTARQLGARQGGSVPVDRRERAAPRRVPKLGVGGRLQFWRNGAQVGAIHIRAEKERIYLEYRVRSAGEDWKDVVQVVGLTRLPCPFGGERPYFLCPGNDTCGRRVGKLYGADRLFLCRHCSKLTYASQCEDTGTRLRRKGRKVLRQLDGDTSDWISVQRPKGMWHHTFERLRRKAFELEMDAETLFEDRMVQIKSQLGKSTRRRQR
jgi:hypothetical protein